MWLRISVTARSLAGSLALEAMSASSALLLEFEVVVPSTHVTAVQSDCVCIFVYQIRSLLCVSPFFFLPVGVQHCDSFHSPSIPLRSSPRHVRLGNGRGEMFPHVS